MKKKPKYIVQSENREVFIVRYKSGKVYITRAIARYFSQPKNCACDPQPWPECPLEHTVYYHRGEFFLNPEEAIKRANDIRNSKIERLKADIEKLESLKIEIPDYESVHYIIKLRDLNLIDEDTYINLLKKV